MIYIHYINLPRPVNTYNAYLFTKYVTSVQIHFKIPPLEIAVRSKMLWF